MPDNKQFVPKISSFILPEPLFKRYMEFMNTPDENGFSMWDWLSGTNIKTAKSKKEQKYISDSAESTVEVPSYMQDVTILFGGKHLLASYVVPKCYAWEITDPSEFKIDPKAAAAAKTLQAYLTQNPEAAKAIPPDVLAVLGKLS